MKYMKLKKIALSILLSSMIFTAMQSAYAVNTPPTNEEIIAAVNRNKIKKDPGDVVIHYRPKDNNHQYYLYVWDTHTDKDQKFIPMTKREVSGKEKEQYAVIKAGEGVKKLKYLITKEDHFASELPNDGKVINDMEAPINQYTATDVFHNEKNDWYSLYLNVQSHDFDLRYGYQDKIVENKTFKPVGKVGSLGATLNKDGSAKVNVWAPTANKVNIRLYKSVKKDETSYISLPMIKGTDANYGDHKKNTIGVWSINLSKDTLSKYGIHSMDGVSYDLELTMPHSYFIQKTEHWEKQSNNEWKYVADKYINSADGTSIKTTEGKEKIAKFYIGEPKTVVTQDPYSTAAVRDGNRSVIIDPSKIGDKVYNSKNKRVSSYTQMSVMEMNVRDFTISKNSGVKEENRGNYLGVIEKGTINPQTKQKTGIDYLEYLGVKYVQILPVSDYETVPELTKNDPKNNEISNSFRSDDQQNWGYDPKNYNVPEGSYASDPADPKVRIKELKQMVQGLHNSGINVVMDVVYNHLYAGQNNPFEYTCPGYYYAVNSDGKMNNDIGVGNAVRGNCEMMRRYIVNSVAYWAIEYGMDGFRFDAMSDLDIKTLNEIRKVLDSIDPKICTYGEGWDSMGKYLPSDNGPGSISNASKLPKYAFFDSKGRDAISGSVYDNPNPAGFVNNQSSFHKNPTDVCDSMLGGHKGKPYINASQQLNYVEVHDGKTLADLMKYYNPHDDDKAHKKRVEFATSMSTLSQGINFVQIGQEFLKSKKGDHNTYNAGDEKNMINWNQIKENADSVNFMKSLLTFRQNEALLHKSNFKDIHSVMKITNAQENSGIITYELTNPETKDKYLVIFNNNRIPDNNRKLTIGRKGDNYYYGAKHKDKTGNINGNDFTNAFIVTSNSENLYNKIGQFNKEENITMEYLSTTVLFIPSKPTMKLMKKTQNIHYLHNNKEISKTDKQTLSTLTVTYTNPNNHFKYEKSGISTNSDKDLGYKANVLSQMNPIKKEEKQYYASDKDGNLIDVSKEPELDEKGKPIDTKDIIWHELKGDLKTKEVKHPQFEDKEIIDKDSDLADFIRVMAAPLKENRDIHIKYDYKKVQAQLISKNDPKNILSLNPEGDYISTGKIHSQVTFNITDKDLERKGYTYTINGFKSLKEALVNEKYKLNGNKYEVIYKAKEAKAKIVYYDQDNQKEIETEELTGSHDQLISHKLKKQENYELVSSELKEDSKFDANEIKTYQAVYKHLHKHSEIEINVNIHYNLKDKSDKEIRKVIYKTDTDLVTKKTVYTPVINSLTITPKNIQGYKSLTQPIVLLFEKKDTKPEDLDVEISYEKLKEETGPKVKEIENNKVKIKAEKTEKEIKTKQGKLSIKIKKAASTGDKTSFHILYLSGLSLIGIIIFVLLEKRKKLKE